LAERSKNLYPNMEKISKEKAYKYIPDYYQKYLENKGKSLKPALFKEQNSL